MGIIRILLSKKYPKETNDQLENRFVELAKKTNFTYSHLDNLDWMSREQQTPQGWMYYSPKREWITPLEDYFGYELWENYFACPPMSADKREGPDNSHRNR